MSRTMIPALFVALGLAAAAAGCMTLKPGDDCLLGDGPCVDLAGTQTDGGMSDAADAALADQND